MILAWVLIIGGSIAAGLGYHRAAKLSLLSTNYRPGGKPCPEHGPGAVKVTDAANGEKV